MNATDSSLLDEVQFFISDVEKRLMLTEALYMKEDLNTPRVIALHIMEAITLPLSY